MASYMEFPLRFKRQYAEPLDASAYAETLADLDDIKNDPTSYVGMIVSCKEDGNVYKLGLDKEFTLLGVGTGGSSIDYMTKQELDNMFGTVAVLPYNPDSI